MSTTTLSPTPKIFIVCIDALSSTDHERIAGLPHLGPLAAGGAVVRRALPVFPSLTYPNHVTIITGRTVAGHGIYHNEAVKAGEPGQPWFNQHSMITTDSLLDVAARDGRSTGAVSWPLTGGAPWDLVLPMIVPYTYTGWDPEPWLRGNATDSLLDEYLWRYGYHLMGEGRSLDAFTMAVVPDILRDHGQPDVMLVKLCDLDSARHGHGLESPEAEEELRRHDQQVGVLLESLRRWGDLENTIIAVTGDHGIKDVTGQVYVNVLLREAGLLNVADDGTVGEWQAYCHSAGQSGWIQLRHANDEATRSTVDSLLSEIVSEGRYGITRVLTKDEAFAEYGLAGPFDYVLTGDQGTDFLPDWDVTEPYVAADSPHFTGLRGNHGGPPDVVPTYAFFHGPGISAGVEIAEARLIDIAPTLARAAGLDLGEVDGRVLTEALVTDAWGVREDTRAH